MLIQFKNEYAMFAIIYNDVSYAYYTKIYSRSEKIKFTKKFDIIEEEEVENRYKILLGKIALLQVGEIIYVAYNLSKPLDESIIHDIDDFFIYVKFLRNMNLKVRKDSIKMSEEGTLFYFMYAR